MKKSRYSETQIVKILKKVETVHISEHSDQSFPLFFKQVVVIFTYLQHLRRLCSLDLRAPRQ